MSSVYSERSPDGGWGDYGGRAYRPGREDGSYEKGCEDERFEQYNAKEN